MSTGPGKRQGSATLSGWQALEGWGKRTDRKDALAWSPKLSARLFQCLPALQKEAEVRGGNSGENI